ncbi:DUF3052 family protein [Qipengyuania vesicularis]|uniref:DUF3052 family protein n=1 Tax=Qipengyuania vesicularis TaxID=2867232 RepID=UPI001C875F8F|nr:DUF3052 family protein [Qipengyuania vesicularis]MBX7527087.1 DUF3052 domain-containing protein [Qipengyuania vesicularis]
MTAGYSGTPLAKKLNLRDGQRVWFHAMPETVIDEIDEYALELIFVADPAEGVDAAHIFVTETTDLETRLARLKDQIAKDGQIWVSWPKKGSGFETALDQAEVQRIGLACGLVDTKKCAVDEIWSGLKFVIPKADR